VRKQLEGIITEAKKIMREVSVIDYTAAA